MSGTDDPAGADIAEKAGGLLAAKAAQPAARMAVLAMLAGAFIAFGSIASLVAQAGADGAGAPGGVQVLAGAAFSVGLILVMLTGAELFTGNTMMALPLATGSLSPARLAGAWAVVWIGNLAGSVAVAALFAGAGGLDALDGQVGDAARALADTKLAKNAPAVLASGLLANMLVCLAVWASMAARTTVSKVAAIVGPITVFVAAGLEHSVANMSLLPLGALAGGAADMSGWATNLACSTLGNIAGGAALALGLAFGHDALAGDG